MQTPMNHDNQNLLTAFLTFLGVAIGAILTLVGVMVKARRDGKTSIEVTHITSDANDRQLLTKDLWATVQGLQGEVKDLRTQLEQSNKQVQENWLARAKAEIATEKALADGDNRLRSAEAKIVEQEKRITQLVDSGIQTRQEYELKVVEMSNTEHNLRNENEQLRKEVERLRQEVGLLKSECEALRKELDVVKAS